ncbi:hypothetical protein Poli38472_005970 [Pythium oligandrum]|uniref:Uncharacterized protein n=1 Tax=Pythium oligandrum TaxID=41045 RepID=A0A8K1CTI6_PYTOL|nr:hypothetical protein Poli38472_005970 [Pythium oligandrum]|eukprot:TMW68502.1 hypothetical protein Poli38472_005970 [Pythium oligandrum]
MHAPSEATVEASALTNDSLIVDSLDDASRKRTVADMDGGEDYEDEEEDEYGTGKDDGKGDKRANNKRSRRHNWQAKYEMEFGLLAIERDSVSGDVTLAMCGFCKAFGREGKYEQLLQPEPAETTGDTKKRRRRSLTTTKFFRAFRVDNIRSHLQGAHPRRWAEYEMLPKQEAIRARYLQMHGDFQYDNLPIDDVLGGSSLNTESDIAYAQAQAHALGSSLSEPHHGQAGHSATVNGSGTAGHFTSAMVYSAGPRSHFDYEKHLVEQLALDRERLEFEKTKFKKEVELRERELAQREKMMEQERLFHEKQLEAANEKAEALSNNFSRLGEVIRDALANNTAGDSVV